MRGPRWAGLLVALVVILALPAIALAGGDGEFSDYESRGWGWMYLAAFGFGFLTSLTPCVYPMIPITLAIFGARGSDVSRKKALLLATVYVLGMGVTYSVLGVAVALLSGAADFGTQLGHPAVVIPLVILFVALAASMFGAFELNLPSSLQARLNQIGGKGFGGAFGMGLVGGLIAAPCTGPFLAGLLAYVSTTGSVVGGGSLLFVYALGMGVLFWALAAFALSLPKSGAWMEAVKSVGGIALLWAAIYFLRPLVRELRLFASPDLWFLFASIGLAIVGIAIGAVKLSFGGPLSHKLRKGIGVALVVAGAYAAWDWKLTPKQHLPWVYDEVAAFERARVEGKGVMVDFSATWCGPCDELELTFGEDEVYATITANFVPLKFDVTEDTPVNEKRKETYGATTLPAVIFVDTEGNRLATIRKMIEPDQMMRILHPTVKKLRALEPPPQQQLPWVYEEATAFSQARAEGKGVMVNFGAEWCVPCQELEKTFASGSLFQTITRDFVTLKLDVTNDTDAASDAKARYMANTLPAVILVDTEGNRLARIDRVMEPAELLGIIRPAAHRLRANAGPKSP